MSTPNFKQDLLQQFARVGKALSNANRLEMLEFLGQGECDVETLSGKCGLSVANTSQHLQQLRHAGLVRSRKEGLRVYYSLTGLEVNTLLHSLQQVAENNLAEVDMLVNKYLSTMDDLEPIEANELLKLAKKGNVTVLDVRPTDEYEAGHIAGALNVPLAELEKHLKKLPKNREIVAYCRGPYCVLAYTAVEQLRKKGYKVRRLEDGYPEWQSSGLPVE
ncbi:MAG: metalloregulator ArsR/SmtB family transcription factor [Gammaproteobacteria bacterium]|nr:metalloregulator ArsR/SmtB family transcription factor [Gammaproteobacteria bacterium]